MLLFYYCILKCDTELRQYTGKPLEIKVTGEASSVAVEWSHDVCRFLLKWLPGFKSSQVLTVSKRSDSTTFGKQTESDQTFQSVTDL